jgi:uncharacterized protein (TIGR02099 family)
LLTWLRRLPRALTWLALAIGLCMAAGWAALHAWIVPRIDDFRPALERVASRTMGMTVQVGELRAESTGWVPSFELRQIRLLDAEGRPALSLPRVVVAISVRSVLHLGLEQLVLDRPELDVRHTASGQWLVAGLALGSSGSQHHAATDWLFGQREVIVRGGTVRWTSERASASAGMDPQQARPLTLTDVDLVLRNALRQHELRLDATPPPDWGERFVLMGRMRRGLLSVHPGNFQDWSGQAFAWFPQVDVSQLRQHVRLGADLLSGQGRLRLWSDIRQGQWQGGTADLDLRQVRLRLSEQLQVMGFERLSGRVSGQHDSSGWSLNTEKLAFISDQGLVWPGGNLRVQHQLASGAHEARGELQGEQLDLQALRELALRLPLSERWHDTLAKRSIGGLVRSLRLQWAGEAPQSLHEVQGQIEAEQLHIAAMPGSTATRHGLQGAQLSAQWSAQGGHARIRMPQGGSLTWPDLLEEDTVPLAQLDADTRWQQQDGQATAVQWKVQLANDDLQGQTQGQWQAQAGSALGHLDLQGQLARARASRIYRYLPLTLPTEVRRYVQDSVRSGSVSDGRIRIRGDLDKLPMPHARDGEFRFAGRLHDVDMAYVPARLLPAGSAPWPALQGLQGDLVFERQGMRLSAASARFGEGRQAVLVQRLRADIPDLTHDARLDIQAELKGPAQQVLRTLQQSPVDHMLSGALSQATASGALQGRLRLGIPLLHAEDTRVQGSVNLAGNDVQIAPQVPLLEKSQGVIQFSESSFALQGVQTRLLGGSSRIDGGLRVNPPAGEPALLIRAQGQVSAEGLLAAHRPTPLDTLARQLKGQTGYSASLGWRNGQPELQLRSSLEGLEIGLPAPLGKRATQALPMSFASRMLDSPAGGSRELLQLQLGQIGSASYVRDLSGAQPRVLRGSVVLGTGTQATDSLPDQGVSAVVRLDDLPVDAWQAAWPASTGTGEESDAAWLSYLPNRLGLQALTLTTQGRTLHDVVAGITREGSTWRANLDARELSGHAIYNPATRQQAARLFARLARLNLPPSAVSEVESLMEAPPASMPSLDIQIEDLTLRGKRLGRIEIEAVNAESRSPRLNVAPSAREWQLQKFNVSVPEASLRASGRWAAAEGSRARRTEMAFRLDVQDAGALLTRLGTPGALRAGSGHLEGQIGWNGSPLSLHYPSLAGQFQVRMGRGQFLQADPGAAKLLGVLSLQGLPRRLLLDFRDVFYEGFAFDNVQGDVLIQQGIASTQNLQIEGVNALVKMDGSADIARETQQLRVLILPQLDAGGASVMAGLALNPMVGLTSFLAQWLLKSPLSRAAIQEFSIDGSWSEPRVTRMELPNTRGGAPVQP